MGELVEKFGGRVSGELIKASDWNGMLATVEELIEALATSVDGRLDALETRADDLEDRADGLSERLDDAEQILSAIRSRWRRLDLNTTRSTFAIGQRGEIVARLSGVDGTPVDLSDPAARPWVDFVTVWGTLKPVSGFVSRGGAGDQTLSVQVNESGEARVLIRAAHAEAFAEEEEQEVEGFLSTRPSADSSATIADLVLGANTPRDGSLTAAYQAVSREYDRGESTAPVFQRYIDAYYVTQPSRATGNFTSVFSQRWRDYRATVMAFVKPDSDPTTTDGAQASASIQVTFRDWIAPWIVVDYLPGVSVLEPDYVNRFRNVIRTDFGLSMSGIVGEVNEIVADKGIIAKQRDLLAIDGAIGGLTFESDPPPFMADLVQAVQFGTQVQQSLLYGQSITPGAGTAVGSFAAVASTSARASAEAGRVQQELTQTFDARLDETSKSLLKDVEVAQVAFRDELLEESGPILSVQRDIKAFSGTIADFQTELRNKADVSLISSIVGTLPR